MERVDCRGRWEGGGVGCGVGREILKENGRAVGCVWDEVKRGHFFAAENSPSSTILKTPKLSHSLPTSPSPPSPHTPKLFPPFYIIIYNIGLNPSTKSLSNHSTSKHTLYRITSNFRKHFTQPIPTPSGHITYHRGL